MRLLTIGLCLVLGPVLAICACDPDPGSHTGGTGGGLNCDDVTVVYGFDAGNSCDVCLHKECCAEIAACTDTPCLNCVNLYTQVCKYNQEATTVHSCLIHKCHDICYPTLSTSSGAGGSGGGTSSSSSG